MSQSVATHSFFHRTIVGVVGNIMEWYDFAVYGFFVSIIGRQFFPSDDPIISLIASFGTFAGGFLMRPIGGILFGSIGDKIGRQRAMYLSVMTMALPTMLIGALPTYASVGVWAPILLITIRLIQGLSVGGEYTSSLVFLVESSPDNKRAYNAMWGSWGASVGTLLGSGVGFLIAFLLTPEQLESWGWRLAFIFGGSIAFLGLYLRSGENKETHVVQTKTPIKDVFTKHWRSVLRVTFLNIGHTVAYYAIFVYSITFLEQVAHFSYEKAIRNNTITMILPLLILPISAKLSDKYGRKPLLWIGFGLMALTAIPLYGLLGEGIRWVTILCQLMIALPLGIVGGVMAATNAELMPREIRCTGLAFSYNISVGIFGGCTPLFITWASEYLEPGQAPGYLVAAAGLVSVATLFFAIKETSKQPL